MRKLIFVAVALATGVSSFAASAANSDRVNTHIVPVKTAPAQPAKLKNKETLLQAVSRVMKPKQAKAERATPAKATAKRTVAGKSKKRFVKTKTLKVRTREAAMPQIDMTTTASVAKAAVRPNQAGIAYGDIVSRYAASYGVPASLAHAVIRIESNYRVNARGSAGEIGLMQIKPATARMMGYTGSANGLFNPETNIKFGMKYLALAHKLGGGATCGTILRYNAGHAAKRMNPVSSAYCSKVKRHLAGA